MQNTAAALKTPAITPKIVAEQGLTQEEYKNACRILGREPNLVELGIIGVMWSEHCSYKTTRKWLKNLPTTGKRVICGPGENAGVVDIGEGLACIFKMESHNHPSFIEPYQGAATGVGGILRDVFTMGARPIANLNALRFGATDHPKTKHLVSGVVAGIGGYGNCVGVPTVGGECTFHPAYNGNILVNAMTVGIAKADKIFYSKASGIGNPVVYVGAKTGRDGIHGATMASAEFTAESEEKRPTVQVGDPFTEKLLIEACLELMATDAIVSIQDMGAAGLTSSSFEMAGKGGLGIELWLDKVPVREEAMTPYEIMLSESQERMLIILKPGKEDVARTIFEKWELAFATIGTLTDTGRLIAKMHGEIAADLPVAPLSSEAPVYDRPYVLKEVTADRLQVTAELLLKPATCNLMAHLRTLIASPDLCSKRWIWEQYDHMVMNDTVARPGGDAAVVRLRAGNDSRIHGTHRALAMSTDCTPRYCFADPVEGGKQAVAENWRNLTAVGAEPIAITNCLNFGNPERPEIMGQIVGCLQGMGEACRALDYPIVSGNVSLYNETEGKGILPTPAIGGVGLLESLDKRCGMGISEAGLALYVVGETKGHLGQSLYLRECLGREEGAPPPVDLTAERRHGDFVRAEIGAGRVKACHDAADGGLLVAVAEMCLSGGVGANLTFPADLPTPVFAFAEDQARYVLAVAPRDAAALEANARKAAVPLAKLGETGGDAVAVSGQGSIGIAELRTAHEGTLPELMA